jgi:DNA-binding Lrp family transcriptional regulator
MLQPIDGRILHSLQLHPRVSFRRIAQVLGVPEQSVARRYHRMRRDGVVRVVGVVNPRVFGDAEWLVRVRAKPGDLSRLADVLVRRPEVTHANVHSAGTELVCVIRGPLNDSSDGLLQRLPRTTTVLDVDIDLMLHRFDEPAASPWTALGQNLSAEQAADIMASADGTERGTPVVPTDEDARLLEVLAEDGRAPTAQLAEATGWSAAKVARRLAALQAGGALAYDVDILPEPLGFDINAMLWLTTTPAHVHAVGTQIAAHAEIAAAAAISGRHNLMAIAICRDVDDLYRYLAEKLAAVDHIQTYDVSIRTQRLKETTSLISRGRLIHGGSLR